MNSTGNSKMLCSRPGTVVALRATQKAAASSATLAIRMPTMLFVTTIGPISNSGSAAIATWTRDSSCGSSGTSASYLM